MTFLPQSYTQFAQTKLLIYHKNNTAGNNSANIANVEAVVNSTAKKKMLSTKNGATFLAAPV